MPPPVLQQCWVSTLVKRVAALETRVNVTVVPGPDITLMADPDQLEQMLINLLRNAAEAMLEPSTPVENSNGSNSPSGSESEPQVVLTWKLTEKDVILTIEDSGPGLMNPSNVFVPFYTTKPGGSGIGLLVSRQISEAHGGFLELANRRDQRGCAVKVILPRTTLW
jgi:two-component system, NtrC family, nitrogen regulation sensor histidine kinase NtrY